MPSPLAASLLASTATLLACGDAGRRDAGRDTVQPGTAQDSPAAGAAASGVTVQMFDAVGKDLGTLTLTEAGPTITVVGRISGLPPGEHAIHLHTAGRCDRPKFEAAGDHWNPTKRQHGTDNPKGPHLGDLPNLTVGQDRSATIEATTPGGTLRGENALLDSDGAAVVVHAKRDDYKSQPAGNSGDRIACGVVSSS
jgi:Cu-Zn family superoxide dismutase